MSGMVRSSLVAVILLAGVLLPAAWAENEGQPDLDRATEAKLTAGTIADLTEVIRLCRSARDKGLDEDNTKFAQQLEASALFQRAVTSCGLVFQSGMAHPKASEFRKLALDDLEKSIELVPEQPEALLLVARLNLLPQGNRKRAAEVLDEALALQGTEPRNRVKMITMRADLETDPQKKLALLDEAVRLAPDDADTVRARGVLRADMKQLEAALEDLDRAVELEPNHAPTHQARALLLGQLKRYDEALVSLDKAQQLQPGSVSPLTIRAQVHVQQMNLDAALLDLNQALAQQPDNVVVLLLRASLYDELGKPEQAMADIDRALALEPDFERGHRLRAMFLARSGNLDQVIPELEAILETSPDDTQVQGQLALLYTVQKQPQKAIDLYTAILAQKPDDSMALAGRANALLGMGKHAEAVADYQRVVKLLPEDSNVLNNFAWVLATSPDDALRDGARAIELATKACELTEFKQAHILSTLAAAYAETGDFDSAIKWSKQAIELGKDGDASAQESLAKELESYKAKKPIRERLDEGLHPEQQ